MRFGLFSIVDHYPDELERSTAAFYAELLEQAQLADELGFHSFWIAEHHFDKYGAMPKPAVFLAAAAARTKRIRLGSAVAVLPFDNPLRAAEDYAMLDIISNGRLEFGVGSGYLEHEFAGFGLDQQKRRQRFDEALKIIRKSWSGETFEFSGEEFKLSPVQLNVLPIQKPEPPISIAVLRSEAALFVGKQGVGMLMIPYATTEKWSELVAACDAFYEGFNGSGGREANKRIYFGLHSFCAATNNEAKELAEPYLERYVRTRLYAQQRPFEHLQERNLLAVGDPAEMIRIASLYEEAGFTDFLMIMNFGGLPQQSVLDSMKLIAREVFPHFSNAKNAAGITV